jgi:hypothetical protein
MAAKTPFEIAYDNVPLDKVAEGIQDLARENPQAVYGAVDDQTPGIAFNGTLTQAENPAVVAEFKDVIQTIFDNAPPGTIGKDLGLTRIPMFLFPAPSHVYCYVANSSVLTVGRIRELVEVHGGSTNRIFFQTKASKSDWNNIFGCHLDQVVIPEDHQDGEPFYINNSINVLAREGNEATIQVLKALDLTSFDPPKPQGIDRLFTTPMPGWDTSPLNSVVVGTMRKDVEATFGALMKATTGSVAYDTRLIVDVLSPADEFRHTAQFRNLAGEQQKVAGKAGSFGNHGGPESCGHSAAVSVRPHGDLHTRPIRDIGREIVDQGTAFYRCTERGLMTQDFDPDDARFVEITREEALEEVTRIFASEGMASAQPGRLSYNDQYNNFGAMPEDEDARKASDAVVEFVLQELRNHKYAEKQ